MENPRPEKVAVVDEVRTKLSNSQAALLTEYRGIGVADMSALRRSLRARRRRSTTPISRSTRVAPGPTR